MDELKDSILMCSSYKVSDLEKAARLCMAIAKKEKSIWAALVAQNCAITIRKSDDWTPYHLIE